MPSARLTRVSILPAGRGAAGYNLTVPQERVMVGKRDLENQACVLLAGRAAELLAGGDDALTAGASNDLDRAAEIVAAMVTKLGMDGEPAVSLKAVQRCCGGAGDSAGRCREVLQRLYARAQRVLVEECRRAHPADRRAGRTRGARGRRGCGNSRRAVEQTADSTTKRTRSEGFDRAGMEPFAPQEVVGVLSYVRKKNTLTVHLNKQLDHSVAAGIPRRAGRADSRSAHAGAGGRGRRLGQLRHRADHRALQADGAPGRHGGGVRPGPARRSDL